MTYVKHETISLKFHPELNEKRVQGLIANDPSIIGLGYLVLRDKERVQPRAGRLDLLLQDRDSKRRYEMEIQLGATDEGHIIRTIEYWDIERKRYPQYEHCAVLVAEDITSRFLNVISLFNGTIPLIAIQMQALTVSGNILLVFTKVMDEMTRGLARISAGGRAADAECRRMVSEKIAAGTAARAAAAKALAGGKGIEAATAVALAPVKRAVRANHRRLSRAKKIDSAFTRLRRLLGKRSR
jgi:hypothetical protein